MDELRKWQKYPDVVAGPLSDLQGTFLKETTEKRDHTENGSINDGSLSISAL